ncbi:MAG TPA: hypothetical protein VGN88_11715 [Phycisphaerae bacterium]|jgi:hypothetical protein
MESSAVRTFLHDLNNQLNAANLNTCLLKQLHEKELDAETVIRLESALLQAIRLTKEFQGRVQAEAAEHEKK